MSTPANRTATKASASRLATAVERGRFMKNKIRLSYPHVAELGEEYAGQLSPHKN